MLPGLLQGSMMSSMIYTQGHIGEEMYKTTRIIISLANRGQKHLIGIKVKNVNDQAVFLSFLSLIYLTVSITVESRSCDTTTCQLALNGGSVVQFTLTHGHGQHWSCRQQSRTQTAARDLQLKRFAFRSKEWSNKQCFCLSRISSHLKLGLYSPLYFINHK